MNQINKYLISIFIVMLFVNTVQAQCTDYTQDIPALVNTELTGIVSFDDKTGIYTYSYTLKSGEGSIGCIWYLAIDVKAPEDSLELSTDGLIDNPKFVQKTAFSNPESEKMIPVSFPTLPKIKKTTAWSAGLTVNGEARWGSNRTLFNLAPGAKLEGFILQAHGLPAIREFKVKPRYNPQPFKEGEDTPENVNALLQTRKSLVFIGTTVGPSSPPSNIVPVDFLEYIISLKHEAHAKGWITNQGIVESLDVKLDNVKKKLEQNNTKAVINILEAFINEVEAQGCETYNKCPKGKHIKPEAYALLKYNAKYLIDNIKQ